MGSVPALTYSLSIKQRLLRVRHKDTEQTGKYGGMLLPEACPFKVDLHLEASKFI